MRYESRVSRMSRIQRLVVQYGLTASAIAVMSITAALMSANADDHGADPGPWITDSPDPED